MSKEIYNLLSGMHNFTCYNVQEHFLYLSKREDKLFVRLSIGEKRILTILSVMLFMFCVLIENSSANCMCYQQLIFIKKLSFTDLK